MKCNMKRVVLALALAGMSGVANATPLPQNTPDASAEVVANSFGGTLLDSVITNVSNSNYSGVARAAVYDTGSGLDFYYQFTNDASSRDGIERLSFGDFGSFEADIFQTAAAFDIFTAGTENSDAVDRVTNIIGFDFEPNGHSKIDPGLTSFTQIIRTNAHSYVAGTFGILDGIGENAQGFAPAVPEPETYAMMLAGLGLIGLIGRRRLHRTSPIFA